MFYILDNGGDVVFAQDDVQNDSKQLDSVNRNLSELFQKGFYFYHDASRNRVISYFKGNAGSGTQLTGNQFYGFYEGDGTEEDILGTFENEVESAFANLGWRLSKTGQSADSIYTHLKSSSPEELAVDNERLHRLLEKSLDDPLQLGTPDFSSALPICKRLISDFEDIKVAICTSGVVEELPETDVVVVPKDTDEPGVPTRDTKELFEKEDLERRIETTKSDVTSFVESGDADERRERVLVEALESGYPDSGVESIRGLDIRVDTPDRRKEQRSRISNIAGVSGGVVAIILALGLSLYYGALTDAVGVLNSTVYFRLGFVPGVESIYSEIPVRSWLIVGVCSLTILLLSSPYLRTGKSGVRSHLKESAPVTELRAVYRAINDARDPSRDEGGATGEPERILSSLYEIDAHVAIKDFEGFEEVSEEIFSNIDSLNVYDDFRYRRSNFVTGVWSFIKGGVGVSTFVALFFVLGVVTSTFWVYFLGLLIAIPLVLIGMHSLPIVVRTGTSLVGVVWSTGRQSYKTVRRISLPSRRECIRGVILLAGTWATTQLGSMVWQSGEGLSYQLLVGLADEIPGRFVSVDVGVEMLFFGAVGFVLVALSFSVRNAEEPFFPAVLFLATLGGLGHLWYDASVVLVSEWAWLVGLAFGVLMAVVAGVLEKVVDYPTPEQVTSGISVFFGFLLTVSFVESHLEYTSPLRYAVSRREFELVALSFSGYPYELAFGTVLFSVLYFVITLGALSVLSSVITHDGDHVEALVVGPLGSDPFYHVSLLFHHFHTEAGTNPSGNDKVEKIRRELDKIGPDRNSKQVLEWNGVEPVKFTTSPDRLPDLTVWAPLTAEYSTVGRDVIRQLDNVDQKKGSEYLPEEGSNRTGAGLVTELARAIATADVLVLLFPMNVQPDYLERYLEFLEDHLGEGQRAIGVISNTSDFVSKYEKEYGRDIDENWEDFSRESTHKTFEGCRSEIRENILSHLDNGENGFLLPVLEDANEETMGAEQEREYLLE